jgi:hypothetical protein
LPSQTPIFDEKDVREVFLLEFSIEGEIALWEANIAAVTLQEAEPNFVPEPELPEIDKIKPLIQINKLENKIIIKSCRRKRPRSQKQRMPKRNDFLIRVFYL